MVENYDNLSDELVFAQFIEGRSTAFDELVNRYYKQIYRFLVRFTGRPHMAEDLIQDVFMKVSKSAETFDQTRKLRPWLYSIAANRARDALRSVGRADKQIVIHKTDGDMEVSLAHLLPVTSVAPDEEIIAKETTQKVQLALADLPEQLREILVLAYYDQLPYKDISDMLGIPLGTVKSRLHKAVITFGQIWKRYESKSTE
jgi:RNA polymerase sigma-70 factor (ECF subfamily)